MRHQRGLHVLLPGASVSLLLCGLIAGCADATPSSNDVNVLWYVDDDRGDRIGGTSRVRVETSESGARPLAIDLRGAPRTLERWQVSAWEGAAVGAMAAGVDPRGQTISLRTKDSIDGPSGGGLLATATWATLEGQRLSPDVAMTGTILPNGAIGPVAGIPAKIQGAAAAGITTVLIPSGTSSVIDPVSLEELNPAEYGSRMGVQVTEVPSIVQASALLRGQQPPTLDVPAVEPTSEFIALIRKATLETSHRLGRESRAVRQARGEPPFRAYATVSLAEVDQVTDAAADRARGRIKRSSASQFRTRLAQRIESLTQRAHWLLERESARQLTHLEQFPALADALTWITGSMADLRLCDQRLAGGTRALIDVSRELAFVDYRLDRFLPLQLDAIAELGYQREFDRAETLGVLDGYADLLGSAADASMRFARGEQQRPLASVADRTTWQKSVWQESPQSQPNEQATTMQRLAAALSYYVSASYVVVMGEYVDLTRDERRREANTILDPGYFRDQLRIASEINDLTSAQIIGRGQDASYVAWGNDWGRSWALESNPGLARGTGLTYQWFANVQGRILASVTSPRQRGR